MLPHYPASSEWATVGGYVAARGSGVLSHPLRQDRGPRALAAGRAGRRRADRHRRGPAPRRRPGPHAAVRRLARARSGSSRARRSRSSRCRPSAASSRCSSRTSTPASRPSGATLAAGHRPSVIRMYDEEATRRTLSPVVGEALDGVCAVVCCEGEAGGRRRGGVPHRRARARGGRARARPCARPALVGPPLRVLQAAASPRAAGDLGHDRRRRAPTRDIVAVHEALQDRRARPLRRPRACSCGCTSRTGTAGAR